MSDEQPPKMKKWRKRAVFAGAALALVCGSLPPEYREVCEALAAVCRGGL